VGDVPLGVFLSGGIDSTSLVALAAEAAGEPPQTVSVVFQEAEYSEEPHIGQVVDRFGTDHTRVEVGASSLLDDLPVILGALDQPTIDGVNTFVVSRAARAAGLTVALSGLGGDELFAGYREFRNARYLHLAGRVIPRPLARPLAWAARARYGDSDRARKAEAWLARPERTSTSYALQRELFSDYVGRSLLRAPSTGPPAPDAPDGLDPVNSVSLLELSHYLRHMLLRDVDVMSMANSLEVRVPFLDHRTVEFVSGLPGAWKLDGSRPKPLLVDALKDLLPAEIARRRKMGFTFPFEEWLRGPLGPEVSGRLADPDYGGQVAELLEPAEVAGTWSRFEEGRTGWSRPWALYVLKVWGERHADTRP
jgi:asparagine synthase (glutamine-hydrolysing)